MRLARVDLLSACPFCYLSIIFSYFVRPGWWPQASHWRTDGFSNVVLLTVRSPVLTCGILSRSHSAVLGDRELSSHCIESQFETKFERARERLAEVCAKFVGNAALVTLMFLVPLMLCYVTQSRWNRIDLLTRFRHDYGAFVYLRFRLSSH